MECTKKQQEEILVDFRVFQLWGVYDLEKVTSLRHPLWVFTQSSSQFPPYGAYNFYWNSVYRFLMNFTKYDQKWISVDFRVLSYVMLIT